MFDEKLKKAEGFILLQNYLTKAVFEKEATPVSDTEMLTRYYKSQAFYRSCLTKKWGGFND